MHVFPNPVTYNYRDSIHNLEYSVSSYRDSIITQACFIAKHFNCTLQEYFGVYIAWQNIQNIKRNVG